LHIRGVICAWTRGFIYLSGGASEALRGAKGRDRGICFGRQSLRANRARDIVLAGDARCEIGQGRIGGARCAIRGPRPRCRIVAQRDIARLAAVGARQPIASSGRRFCGVHQQEERKHTRKDLSAEKPCVVTVWEPLGSPVAFAEPFAVFFGSYCPGPGTLLQKPACMNGHKLAPARERTPGAPNRVKTHLLSKPILTSQRGPLSTASWRILRNATAPPSRPAASRPGGKGSRVAGPDDEERGRGSGQQKP